MSQHSSYTIAQWNMLDYRSAGSGWFELQTQVNTGKSEDQMVRGLMHHTNNMVNLLKHWCSVKMSDFIVEIIQVTKMRQTFFVYRITFTLGK